MAPQYAAYQLVFRPNTIYKIRTIERRNVLRTGFAVGNNHTFIYLHTTVGIFGMWKPIPDFNYEINEYGDVQSVKFNRILSSATAKDGYKQIGIRKSGDRKKHWFRVHRLVASAFCNPPDNAGELDVDHIDRNIQNNHCSNLRWVTRTENNANRQKSAWATNTTTGELYITRYRNGFMVRISNSTVQHRSWHKTIGSAVQTRNAVASGAS